VVEVVGHGIPGGRWLVLWSVHVDEDGAGRMARVVVLLLLGGKAILELEPRPVPAHR
jgi:hypothetical protein